MKKIKHHKKQKEIADSKQSKKIIIFGVILGAIILAICIAVSYSLAN
jgi:orotate phosphoribosyltransferase